jgi:hypothetical protein
MGQTIAGGYYRGVDGKIHDANGNLVTEQSESARDKAVEKAKEGGAGGETPTGTATDPGPLGPLVPTPSATLAETGTKKGKGTKRAKAPKRAKGAKRAKKVAKKGPEPFSSF